MTELDALDPVVERVKLASGRVMVLEDLRARQFFKFLRIITHGAMPVLQDLSALRLDPDADAAEFAGRLFALLAMSVPDAEDEAIEFIRAMCKPDGLVEGRKLSKPDTDRNAEKWIALDDELANPELDDLLTIIEAIVRREAAEIQALGKRLGAMLKLAERTGQIPKGTSEPAPTSSADSPEPSTSSPSSTDGPTPSSETSASDDSARSSRSSPNAASGSRKSAAAG